MKALDIGTHIHRLREEQAAAPRPKPSTGYSQCCASGPLSRTGAQISSSERLFGVYGSSSTMKECESVVEASRMPATFA